MPSPCSASEPHPGPLEWFSCWFLKENYCFSETVETSKLASTMLFDLVYPGLNYYRFLFLTTRLACCVKYGLCHHPTDVFILNDAKHK